MESTEVARKSLELWKTDMQQQLEELEELKEADAKAEADKIREKDLEQGKNLREDDMNLEEAGPESSLKDNELNLRRQAYAKVEHGKPTTASKLTKWKQTK